MFGRRTERVTATPARGTPRTRTVADVETVPDDVTIARGLGLQGVIGRGLQGGAGLVYGYDRGDPVLTLTGPVVIKRDPTAAIAAIGRPGPDLPPATVQDLAGMDSFKLATYARMVNG